MPNRCKVFELHAGIFPGGNDFSHGVGFGAAGDVDVGFHGFVVGVASPFHHYLGRDAAGKGEADEGFASAVGGDKGPLGDNILFPLVVSIADLTNGRIEAAEFTEVLEVCGWPSS